MTRQLRRILTFGLAVLCAALLVPVPAAAAGPDAAPAVRLRLTPHF